MLGYVCDYALISPAILAHRIEREFDVLVTWEDRDEDSFFLSVWEDDDTIWDAIDAVVEPYFFEE